MAPYIVKKNHRVAITGANGFIGRELINTLLADDSVTDINILTSSGRQLSGVADSRIQYIQADLTRASSSLKKFLEGKDSLIHLAGVVSRRPDDASQMMDLHIQGTRNLLDATLTSGIQRVVLLSTSGVVAISPSSSQIADDNSPYALDPALQWPYYASKIFQEKLSRVWARDHQRLMFILRPSLVIGPGDYDLSSTGDILKFLQRKIPFIPPGGLSFVDVRDVARICRTCLHMPAFKSSEFSRTYLLGSTNISFDDYFNLLSRLSGVPAPRMRISRKNSKIGAYLLRNTGKSLQEIANIDPDSVSMANYFWYLNALRAKKELEFTPIEPHKTLLESINFIRTHFQI